jgi:hypothetical protein
MHKSVLFDMKIATPACFWSPHALYNFFQPFVFSFCVCLFVGCVSCRKKNLGSSFNTVRQSVSFGWRVNSVYI